MNATAAVVEGWVGGILWWMGPGRRARMNYVGDQGKTVVYTHVYTQLRESTERKEGEE